MLIRSATLVDNYDHIYSADPALDRDSKDAEGKPDFEERYRLYAETGDASHLPIKQGQQPAVWTLRHVRGQERRDLLDERRSAGGERGLDGLLFIAARLALVGVRGAKDDRGQELVVPHEADSQGRKLVTLPFMNWLDSLEEGKHGVDGQHLVNELGLQVIRRLQPTGKS